MSEKQINSKFEDLLCDVNLEENKKNLLRRSSINYKGRVLKLHEKLINQIKENHEYKDPNDYIDYLDRCFKVNSQNPDIILSCLGSLKIALANYPLQWSREFGHKGLPILCDVLNKAKAFNSDKQFEKIQIETIKCIAKFANNIEGVQEILYNKCNVISTIVTSIDYEKIEVAKVALKLLALLLMQPGLERNATVVFLHTLTNISEQKNTERFKIIVDGILLTEAEEIWYNCLLCITAILSNAKEVEERISQRSEILNRCGLQLKIDTLRKNSYTESLIYTYDKQEIEDELEFELKNRLMLKMNE